MWASLGALPVCELSLLNKQAALRTGPWPGLNEAKCRRTKQNHPKLGGSVYLSYFRQNLFLAKTFYLDGNVTLERDDFLGSSKRKLM